MPGGPGVPCIAYTGEDLSLPWEHAVVGTHHDCVWPWSGSRVQIKATQTATINPILAGPLARAGRVKGGVAPARELARARTLDAAEHAGTMAVGGGCRNLCSARMIRRASQPTLMNSQSQDLRHRLSSTVNWLDCASVPPSEDSLGRYAGYGQGGEALPSQ